MSELGKLEGDAEQYAKDHPQQVQEGEQDAEHALKSKFGTGGGQDQGSQQDQGNQQEQTGQQGQDGQQGGSDQDTSRQDQGQGQQ
jgi:hypothetical protein